MSISNDKIEEKIKWIRRRVSNSIEKSRWKKLLFGNDADSSGCDTILQPSLPYPDSICPVCKEIGSPCFDALPEGFVEKKIADKEIKNGDIKKRIWSCHNGHEWIPLELEEYKSLTYIVSENADDNCKVCGCKTCEQLMREAPFKGIKKYNPVFVTCQEHV